MPIRVLWIAIFAAGSVFAEADSAVGAPGTLQRFVLDNGLRVWHLQRFETQSVVVAVSVHVGSRDETAENNGISHFLEHMVFAETEKHPEGEVTDVITKRGGNYNATTRYEKTIYYAMLAARDFDCAAEWVSQVVFHPTLPESRVARERNVVFQEKGGKSAWFARALENHGFGYDVDQRLREMLFPESALAMPIIGVDKALNRIDHAALQDYYRSYYMPNNAVLIVVGNVSPEALRDACAKYFSDTNPGDVEGGDPAPAMPEQIPSRCIKLRAPTFRSQCRFMTGARTVPMRDADWWPLEVLAAYLDLAVEKEARLKKGLAYDVHVANDSHSDAGLFYLSTSCERSNRKEVQAVVEDQVARLRDGEVDAERLAEAKAVLVGMRALAMESNMSHAVWLERLSFYYGNDDVLPVYDACVDNVNVEEIVYAAKTYLTPERMAEVVHVPLF